MPTGTPSLIPHLDGQANLTASTQLDIASTLSADDVGSGRRPHTRSGLGQYSVLHRDRAAPAPGYGHGKATEESTSARRGFGFEFPERLLPTLAQDSRQRNGGGWLLVTPEDQDGVARHLAKLEPQSLERGRVFLPVVLPPERVRGRRSDISLSPCVE